MSSEGHESSNGERRETLNRRNLFQRFTSRTLALGVVGLAFSLVFLLLWTRPTVSAKTPEILPPLVQVTSVTLEPSQFLISAQGNVEPKRESDLATEIAGRISERSPSLVRGGFFAKGDILARIDDSDYQVVVDQLEASLALRESERKLAERNLNRRKALADQGVASIAELDTSESQLQVTEAGVREIEAQLKRARLDLDRTKVVAPFSGRVRDVHIEVGEFVGRGASVALVYGTKVAEIRLPISDQDLAYLPFSLGYVYDSSGGTPVEVLLSAQIAGKTVVRKATVDRVEGEIDRRSRMIAVVASLTDPYARTSRGLSAFAPGLFVEGQIKGKALPAVSRLPREALRGEDQVLVLGNDERLHLRKVTVARIDRDEVLIEKGLFAGERVCVSVLEAFTDKMQVRVSALKGKQ